MHKIIGYFLHNRLITALVLILIIIGGLSTVPFNWHSRFIPRNPVAVDAIPDIGDNQQIIATDWMGRSPKRYSRASHIPPNNGIIRNSRCQDHSVNVDVRHVIYLYYL